MIDKAARQLNIDRLRSACSTRRIPTARLADQGPVTSAFLKDALDKAAAMFDWDEQRKRSGQKNGTKVTGIGIGQGYHSAGSNGFDGLVRITPDGKLHVHTGVGNLGTHSIRRRRGSRPRSAQLWLGQCHHRTWRHPPRPAVELAPGRQPHRIDPVAHHVCRGDGHEGQSSPTLPRRCSAASPKIMSSATRRSSSKAERRSRSPMQQAAQKAIELGGKYSGKEVPDGLNPITKSAVGNDRRHRPDRRRQGQAAARRHHAGPHLQLRRDRNRHRDRQDRDQGMLCVADCGTVLLPAGPGSPDRQRPGDGHRHGAPGTPCL